MKWLRTAVPRPGQVLVLSPFFVISVYFVVPKILLNRITAFLLNHQRHENHESFAGLVSCYLRWSVACYIPGGRDAVRYASRGVRQQRLLIQVNLEHSPCLAHSRQLIVGFPVFFSCVMEGNTQMRFKRHTQ